MSLFLATGCGKEGQKQSPVFLQNQTWITAEYAKWDLQFASQSILRSLTAS
jgi:hypothetical protein